MASAAMQEEQVKLLGLWFSPFVRRVEWALKFKGIEYEYVEEDLTNKSSLLLTSNPVHKKVPVLLHNGNPIVESLVIIEYIDENWKQNPILPQDPHERAKARFWANFIEQKITEAMRTALVTQGEQQEKVVKELKEAMEVLEGEAAAKLNDKTLFFGGKNGLGYVDIVLGWICNWVEVIEEVGGFKVLDPQKQPHIHKWMANFVEVPLIKPTLLPKEKMVVCFQMVRQAHLGLAAKK
ncbi:hypothetical protein PVL29_020504 [Vitis rotundifolia]|uniref:glutathione transferase n=2 Tax=Vitis rotundifolia TaxID=103349 RepID=A0AA38YX74_VITRO|nr:hypothetical protein PVL29_020504 [Vitis rotundifolia]